jgi:hypothetical protein
MPLHRDIFWVGRQWAVTGHGMQAIDQQLNGKYDIDIAQLWEDDPAESLRADGWLNAEDFANGLFIARSRYPEPGGETRRSKRPAQRPPRAEIDVPIPPRAENHVPVPTEPPQPAAANFDMRVESWPAKLVFPWRVRRQK